MKRLGLIAVTALLCALLLGARGQTCFINGVVTAVTSSELSVNGTAYPFAIACTVVVQTTRNDAFFEEPGFLRDLEPGRRVTIHLNGNVVDQVIVERWSR